MCIRDRIVGEDNQRYLLKGSFKRKGLEPFNEVLSGMIAQAINLEYIPYTIEEMCIRDRLQTH